MTPPSAVRFSNAPPRFWRGPDLVEAPAHPRAGWRLLRRPRHPERGAEIPGRHGIPAAEGVSVKPRKRRRLEGEHRKARHQTVGKGRAAGLDRIWDAVETLSHRLGHPGHPGHRQMPAEGVCHVPARLRLFCLIMPDSGQKVARSL
ncbi:MAG: hypothetical protein OXD29_05580 [Roseovarius sp.]|nr:hypothetical protein [Roseovarius sp.]